MRAETVENIPDRRAKRTETVNNTDDRRVARAGMREQTYLPHQMLMNMKVDLLNEALRHHARHVGDLDALVQREDEVIVRVQLRANCTAWRPW